MKLHRDIEATRNKYWDTVRTTIGSKAVLFVEGEDDQRSIEGALDALSDPASGEVWQTRLAVVPLGGEERVRSTLRDGYLPGQSDKPLNGPIFGLLDRDQRTRTEIAELRQQHPNHLFITPGWALENLFFDPALMREALARLNPAKDVLKELDEARPAWVRAAMRYTAVQRFQGEINGAMKPLIELKAEPTSLDADPAALLAALEAAGWAVHQHLTPRVIADEIAQSTQAALALPAIEQWIQVIDGKRAFRVLLSRLIQNGLPMARRAFDQALHQHPFIQDLCNRLR